jgi:hypothetical protein
MNTLKNWRPCFHLENLLQKDAEDLMARIVAFCEERGGSVGGGILPDFGTWLEVVSDLEEDLQWAHDGQAEEIETGRGYAGV